jgi:hypothetical protein
VRRRLLDLGQTFGRLTVLSEEDHDPERKYWRCRCACGVESVVRQDHLVSGRTQSCGCLVPDTTRIRSTTHGDTIGAHRAPEYKVWCAMLERCYKPENTGYKHYGARGIRVCDRWKSYENFLSDMGRRPSPKHTIDREHNDGNYEPSNCRWATYTQQARNRSNNRMLSHNGITCCIAEWADRTGLSQDSIGRRLSDGWSIERALTAPMRVTPGKQTGRPTILHAPGESPGSPRS